MPLCLCGPYVDKQRLRSAGESNGNVLSVEAKKHYVDRYLPGVVDQLVKDLDTYNPFGGILS